MADANVCTEGPRTCDVAAITDDVIVGGEMNS